MNNSNTISNEVKALFKILRDRYVDRLTPDEWQEVYKEVENIAKNAETLRLVKLKNSDEPFSVFVPYRKDEG